ncbi:hypothetical protein FQN52_008084 [Onygenales sp. PD_12]|nr:hypothetical protein FQN52_008084 [Onygenales sp. PD_12]
MSSKPEKTMSSRLLTMKFMQRAAAASSASTPQTATPTPNTPSSQPSASPSRHAAINVSTPSPKRRRLSNDYSSPATSAAGTPTDLQAISAAIKAEEEKRAAAIARQAAEAGETEWVIEYPEEAWGEDDGGENGGYVLPATSMDVYADEEEESGRRGYGGFKRKGGYKAKPAGGDGDEDDGEDDEDQLEDMINKAKKQARPVDLSQLTSISGGVSKGDRDRGRQGGKRGKRG